MRKPVIKKMYHKFRKGLMFTLLGNWVKDFPFLPQQLLGCSLNVPLQCVHN